MKPIFAYLIRLFIVMALLAPASGAFAQEAEQKSEPQDTQQKKEKKSDDPCKDDAKKKPECIGERNVGKGINLWSLEKEIALGKALSQQIEQTAKFVEDPVINEYVNRVAQNLVRNSDAQVPFIVKVIDSEEINAFALPGGFFYVNSGLVMAADEEAELAGVMAHEIAHVTARHATKQATKAQIAQWGLMVGSIFLPGGWAGDAIYQGLNYGLPVVFLKFSRDAEREADFLGLQYMYKAGYDPIAFVTFFEKIREKERKQQGSIPKIWSSHPPTPERVAKAQKAIAEILPEQQEYVVTTSEFDLVKARLVALYSGRKLQDQKEGKPTLRGKERKENKEGEEKKDEPPVLKRRD